jgi:hypothetical protein
MRRKGQNNVLDISIFSYQKQLFAQEKPMHIGVVFVNIKKSLTISLPLLSTEKEDFFSV